MGLKEIARLFTGKRKGKKESRVIAEAIYRNWANAIENAPPPLTPDEYSEMRAKQVEWLEAHYDLNSIDGISAIPESKELPQNPFGGAIGGVRSYTGDIEYYLKHKAYKHEEAGNIDLAIACLRKSNAIKALHRTGYRKDDYLALVRMLAFHGYVDEAKEEKAKIDCMFGREISDGLIGYTPEKRLQRIRHYAEKFGTDLVEMSAHGATCPECAKYQGRWFSLSGKSKKFPQIPDGFFIYGGIHPGCSHTFSPVINGVNSPQLEYAVSVQGLLKSKYSKTIIAFSNRPFVDDRPQEEIEKAEAYKVKKAEEARIRQEYEDTLIEREFQRGEKYRLLWRLQTLFPELCPKSLSGYTRMKNARTKNWMRLVEKARSIGIEIDK